MSAVLAFVCASTLFAAAPHTTNAEETHIVSRGESLSAIARLYGLGLDTLLAVNGITNPDYIQSGQRLNIPRSTSPSSTATASTEAHVVAPGESLGRIAARYGVTIAQIIAANTISNPDYIQTGQRLQIPSSSTSVSVPASPSTSAGATHVVGAGESLGWIAAHYGVSIAQIVAANGIANPNYIQSGARLTIPGASGGGAPVVSNVPRLSRDEAGWILYQAEVEFGLPAGIFRALAWQESGWQSWVVSSAGALGLAQVMPETGDWVVANLLGGDAADWRTNPENNARVGAAFFRYLLGLTGWDLEMALAGYYQGLGNVARYGFYTDTRQYIANVLYFRNWYA